MSKVSLPKEKIKILLLEGLHQSTLDTLHANGYENIEYLKTSLPEDELIAKIKDVHFVGIRSRTQLNEKVIVAANKLVAVGCFCIGTNQVDLVATQMRGIPVFNAPFSNTRSVAELALAQIILLLRGVPAKNAKAHKGIWDKSAVGSFEARGKTLGIIGYGHIGTQLSILAEHLGMRVQFFDIENKLVLGNSTQVKTLKQLLNTSDVVTLHVPETTQTQNMIGTKELGMMKDGAILMNAARGTIIDINALVDWQDTSAPLKERVRSYFEINCAHCHIDEGHCSYRPIRLDYTSSILDENIGICVEPEEDLGNGISHIIRPNNIGRSAMYFTLNTTAEEVRMPLLGRTLIHDEAIVLLEEFINNLDIECE